MSITIISDVMNKGLQWNWMFKNNIGYYQNQVVQIDDTDFIMSTLWSRISPSDEYFVWNGMNDFRRASAQVHGREQKQAGIHVIYGDVWLNNEPYAIIHRIASICEAKGIMRNAVRPTTLSQLSALTRIVTTL